MSACLSVCLPPCLSVCQYFMALLAIFPPPSTQASSTAIRDMWAQEIRRLLQDQFTLMKGTPVSISKERALFYSLFPLSPHLFLSSLSSPNLLTCFPIHSSLPPLLSLLFSSPSLPPCRQGDKVWHSEQKYLSWQS